MQSTEFFRPLADTAKWLQDRGLSLLIGWSAGFYTGWRSRRRAICYYAEWVRGFQRRETTSGKGGNPKP